MNPRNLNWRKLFTWPKLFFYAILGLLFAAWYVPRISADKYREPIHTALETALGRKVEIGMVQFQLLPVPGFTVQNVKISEDPAIGPEPVAYISVMRGRPTIASLFGGPLAFASVDLEDTSVNLTRVTNPADATALKWNFPELLRPKLLNAFPSIHLVSGRVNFKFGDTKSVFYLLNTDVDLWPPASDGDPWTLKIRAEPARTDRPARGFGFFVARGQWHQSNSSVTLDVKMEKSELGDMITLFEGHESGIHGDILGSAHLAGPISRLGIAGSLKIGDVHGWNTTPPRGAAVGAVISGVLNLPAQMLELRAVSEGRAPAVDIRYNASDYLKRPKWDVRLLLNKQPIAPLFAVARNIGWGIPADMTLDGTLDGQVGFAMPEGKPVFDGQLHATSVGSSAGGNTARLKIADTSIHFANSKVSVGAVAVTSEATDASTLSAEYDAAAGEFEASIETSGMPLATMRPYMAAAHAPFLGVANGGTWAGSIEYSNSAGPSWEGTFSLKDAAIAVPAFTQPVQIASADAVLDETGFSLKHATFAVGQVEAQGDYTYQLGAARPHHFQITAAKIDTSQLDTFLVPLLRRGNLLTKALNFGKPPEPDWLKDVHADGTVQAASLVLAGSTLSKFRARILWDGDSVKVEGVQFQLPAVFSAQAAFKGDATVDLSKPEAEYGLAGKISGLRWRTAGIEAEGTLATSGTGDDFWARMKASGKLKARNVELAPISPLESLDATFEWEWDGRNPRLKLPEVSASGMGAKWTGAAVGETGGTIVLKLSDGKRNLEAYGAVLKGDALTGSFK